MNTYRIEEEITTGWHEVHSGLTKDEAKEKLDSMIAEGHNPNRLRVRTLLNG